LVLLTNILKKLVDDYDVERQRQSLLERYTHSGALDPGLGPSMMPYALEANEMAQEVPQWNKLNKRPSGTGY
jgi:hypothetical protein